MTIVLFQMYIVSADHESESRQVPMKKRVLKSARTREQKRKANQDQQDDSPEKLLGLQIRSKITENIPKCMHKLRSRMCTRD